MNIFRLLFELFVVYILYKFIFDFIIPVYKTSKQVKQKMNDMNNRMHRDQNKPVNDQFSRPQTNDGDIKRAKEDYIDYEEIK